MNVRRIALKYAKWITRIPFNNLILRKGNVVLLNKALLIGCRILCQGKGNRIEIENGSILFKCKIAVRGDNCLVKIGKDSVVKYSSINCEDNSNIVTIGAGTHICGKTNIGCIESTKITIGRNCLFSSDIEIRSGDSHGIFDSQGIRINHSKDVIVGDHVWLGHGVTILKGVNIANDVVIGTGAIVTKSIGESNCVVVGNPARVVRNNIAWDAERIANINMKRESFGNGNDTEIMTEVSNSENSSN